MMARLGGVIEQIRGVSYRPSDLHENLSDESVILLRANNIQNGEIVLDDVVYVSKSKVSEDQYLRRGDILVCTSSGSKELVGKAAFIDEDLPMVFGAFCKVVRPKIECCEYMGHFFQSPYYRNHISAVSAGANINNLRNEHIADLHIPLPPLDKQRKIAAVLDKVCDLIAKRRQQLDKLDEMVKARFVEMFGDPVSNSLDIASMPMTKICNIIDGDRGKNYPTEDEFSDEGYCLFLSAKNVTSAGFDFENCMFITKEKDELLRKGHLSRGDIVLTTRGTIGNLAFYDDSIPFDNVRINSGMVILRMDHDLVSEHFFIEQFKMQLSLIKQKIASGSAQPQLPISTMNKIIMLVPSVELQNNFSVFVEQSKKSKTAISRSLEKLETVKKALMQEYFG